MFFFFVLSSLRENICNFTRYVFEDAIFSIYVCDRSGVLQVNDEILGINDTDIGMMTAEQCNGILQSFGTHANILVGFTVAGK